MSPGFYDDIIADGVYKFYVNGEWKTFPGKTQKIGNPSTLETAFTVTGVVPFIKRLVPSGTGVPDKG